MKDSHLLQKTFWLVLVAAMLLCLMPAAAQRRTRPRALPAIGPRPELVVQLGYSKGVSCIAFSADGRLLLAGSKDQTARLWETATGRLIRRFGIHEDEVDAVAFSTDGRSAFTATGNIWQVWDTATGQELHRFEKPTDSASVTTLTSSDKHFLMEVSSADHVLVLRSAGTKKELARFGGPGLESLAGGPGGPTKSSDGRYVVESGRGVGLGLKDTVTGRQVRLIGHSEEINAIVFSPDGRTIATGSGDDAYKDNSLRLWDVETGQEIRRFESDAAIVRSVSFSPDGRFLKTEAGDFDWFVGGLMSGAVAASSAHLWDLTTGQEVSDLNAGTMNLLASACSLDGHFVLTGGWETAQLWDADTGQEVTRFSRHSSWVPAVAMSADSRLVLTGSADHTARLWDAITGKELRRFLGHTRGITSVAISHDNRYVLTASDDQTVRLWDAATGKEIRQIEATSPVAFSPDGQSYITGSKQGPTLRETTSGQELRRFVNGASDAMDAVAFSPDGRFVLIANRNHTLRLWEVSSGQQAQQFVGHTGEVRSVAFSRDGRQVLSGSGETAAGKDSTLRLWDVASGKEVRQYGKFSNPVSYVAFAADGQSVWAEEFDIYEINEAGELGRGRVSRFDAATDKELMYIGENTNRKSAIFSADGRLALISRTDNTTRVLDASTGHEIRRLPGISAAISADSRLIATASMADSKAPPATASASSQPGETEREDRVIHLWDAATGGEVRRILRKSPLPPKNADDDHVVSLEFSPDGSLLLAGTSVSIAHLFDVATGQELRQFVGEDETASSVEFTPDGRFVKTAAGDNVGTDARMWDAATGKEVRYFHIDNGGDERVGDYAAAVTAVALSADGRLGLSWGFSSGIDQMAFGETNTPRLWDAATMKEVQRFSGHTDDIFSAAISPDNRLVVTGSKDTTARLWDSKTGKELCRLISFRDGSWVAVAPDGRFDTNNLEEVRGLHWIFPDEPFRPLPLEIFMRTYYEPRLLARILAGEKFNPVPPLASLNRIQPEVRIAQIMPQPNAPDQVSVTVDLMDAKVGARHSGVADLRLFRDGQLVGYAPESSGPVKVNPQTGKAEMVFKNIRLPHRADALKVEFSAYAFNSDRVKSATDHLTYELPAPFKPEPGRAYLITVGVNTYENLEVTRLLYPASDARLMGATLSDTLRQTGNYAEVVIVPLIAEIRERAGEQVIRPTRQNFKTVLDLLAGRQVGAAELAAIPAEIKDHLRAARPEDLVLISFSTHGKADGQGNFYLYPYDTGQTNEELLQHCISSADLSLWLRDVDAGELVMILDACHSGAAPGEDFKPGPMGSRGLGQLAYDKGMRILAATQADNVAQGSGQSARGLLTTALIRDGIERGEAARSRRITMRDWLAFGEKQVPVLYKQEFIPGPQQKVQAPALFDFARRHRDDVLVALLKN